ncbi:hypothetical protein SAMN05421829_102330 [Aromatoleum tolulyticum]|uniref:Uncharacterized protein n=1 Tax=Aromatoleum tolulyticum TaxID=34027 RepID=A0A1N6Q3U6_9RHOO|nr:hypothetical protein [Aromatoleum tolulyticum]SIQ11206.1 hypothetical protein SAMN05421829_102330 [Aromatoleum tolulyticum]
MTAALPELAADRVPVLEDAYLDALGAYADLLEDPRAACLLWIPRQIAEARLCRIEQAHDEAIVTATKRLGERGTLRRIRADLLAENATSTTRKRRKAP